MSTIVWTIAWLAAVHSRTPSGAGFVTTFGQDEALEWMEGLLSRQPAVAVDRARHECLRLPGNAPEVLGPHGDTLLSSRCEVVGYETSGLAQWSAARYAWTLVFAAEDKTRGAG